ncbi:MAG TPA: hypothetical protein VL551_35555 [Actinospica sp.]|nr:hypothetical protein [Actinospica sp.]
MRSTREHAQQARHARQLAGSLTLPRPFDAVAFITSVAEDSGRRIELIPVTGRTNTPCGLLLATDDCVHVFYAADTSPLHQRQILLHEAAHLIYGHEHTAAKLVLPHLSPELIARVLGRTGYTEPQEREAELLASFILRRASREEVAARPLGPSESRLEAAFGRPEPPGRTP